MLKIQWSGGAHLNGIELKPSEIDFNALDGPVVINLSPKNSKVQNGANTRSERVSASGTFRIKVRQYMTKPASPEFDFMAKWNKNIPMPMRVMVGEKLEETPGMVKMRLHGDITTTITKCCMKCGKPITNQVSRYFGMGPECGGHNYVNPFDTDAELQIAVSSYRKTLQKITWEGWIIKKAIEEEVAL